MKIIAIEEAFSMDGLKMVPKLSDYKGPRDLEALADWVRRNADFTFRERFRRTNFERTPSYGH